MMETPGSNSQDRRIEVDAGAVVVQGYLNIPENARGIVLFAQASENISYDYIAQLLREAGSDPGRLATLVVNLLTPEDQTLDRETGFFRDNLSVLHQRIVGIANSLRENPETQDLRIFYFGAGPSGSAALVAAAVRPDVVVAAISANGLLDLAKDHSFYPGVSIRVGLLDLGKEYLSEISVPTLLIVGENDTSAVDTNWKLLDQIQANDKKLEIIPGVRNLFENRNTQEEVARLAGEWYGRFLGLV